MDRRLGWRVALGAMIWVAGTRAMAAGEPDVTLTDVAATYILSNGIVTVQIDKKSGDLASLKMGDKELLAVDPTNLPGHWYYFPQEKYPSAARVVTDPSSNHGDRAEVEVSGTHFASEIKPPATMPSETIKPVIRYSLGRGDSGVYTFERLEIQEPNKGRLPPFRGDYVLRLNDQMFDHLAVDKKISCDMPSPDDWKKGQALNIPEARMIQTGPLKGQVFCKYDNDMRAIDAPAYGWSGKKNGVGIWIVNPSTEYICNPLRVVSTGWLGDKSGVPILANCWGVQYMSGDTLGIYQGPRVPLASAITWSKVIGPFFIYCNGGSFEDAVARQKKEAEKWPYSWARIKGYTPREQRSTVKGEIRLEDRNWTMFSNRQDSILAEANSTLSRQRPTTSPASRPTSLRNLIVGLTTPAPEDREWEQWQSDVETGGRSPFANCQYWARSKDGNHFTIPNVPPGTYTMHAIADGIPGEMTVPNVIVPPSETRVDADQNTLDLGYTIWKTRRLGPMLWEIGSPNRTGDKFLHGDDYRHWGLYSLYASEFPNDVNFVIGSSSEKKDWNYQQPLGSTWTIHFEVTFLPMPQLAANSSTQPTPPPKPYKITSHEMGAAQGHSFVKPPPPSPPIHTEMYVPPHEFSHLWIAYANNSGSQLTMDTRLAVRLNGNRVAGTHAGYHETIHNQLAPDFDDKAVFRDGIQGVWSMDVFLIPLESLRLGDNVLTLQAIAPENPDPKNPMGGIIYDYLRWEQGDFPGREQFIAPDDGSKPYTP